MKYLTSAAMALALAAGAVAAHADPQDNRDNRDNGAHHDQGGGGNQHHGDGGQPGGRGQGGPAPQGGPAHVQAGPAEAPRGAWNGNGGGGDHHDVNRGAGFQPQGGAVVQGDGDHHDHNRGGGYQPQGGAVVQGGGDHHDHNRGGGYQPQGGAVVQGGGDHHDYNRGGPYHPQDNVGVQGGVHGYRGGGNFGAAGRAGVRPGFVPGNHPIRGRDEGRGWFRQGEFARDYHADRRFHMGHYYRPSGWYYRTWGFGDFLPWGWFSNNYYLDWGYYDLPEPPIGCEWVRQGPDALLVDVWTGEVLSVYHDIFW